MRRGNAERTIKSDTRNEGNNYERPKYLLVKLASADVHRVCGCVMVACHSLIHRVSTPLIGYCQQLHQLEHGAGEATQSLIRPISSTDCMLVRTGRLSLSSVYNVIPK